jgi:hypothetical protein
MARYVLVFNQAKATIHIVESIGARADMEWLREQMTISTSIQHKHCNKTASTFRPSGKLEASHLTSLSYRLPNRWLNDDPCQGSVFHEFMVLPMLTPHLACLYLVRQGKAFSFCHRP